MRKFRVARRGTRALSLRRGPVAAGGNGVTAVNGDYERVAAAIGYIRRNRRRQPSLAEIAAAVHASPYHFQRSFRRWAGVSPKRFLQVLTVEDAKRRLLDAGTLAAALEVGLSGPGRLHDHFVTLEAVTPGEFKRRGSGLTIAYGTCASPFGPAFIAATGRGICRLAFGGVEEGLDWLASAWPGARLRADAEEIAALGRLVFGAARPATPLHLLVRGTNFQVQVWRALLAVPPGRLATYGGLARALGNPRAARAVGAAVAANPIGWLIPCHRVIRETGEVGGYAWGAVRKQALIAHEALGAPAPRV